MASSSAWARSGSRPVGGLRRSWYQRHSRSQGVPHARLALRSQERSAASPAAVAPTASASRSANSSRASSLSPVRRPVTYTGRRRQAAASTSAAMRRAGACRSATNWPSTSRSSPMPSPVRADRASTVAPGSPYSPSAMPSSSSSRRRSSRTCSAASPGQPVDLVEDDEGDLRVARHRPQIALVEHGVGVLLRVHDPDDGVDERQDAVHLLAVLHGRRVVVGAGRSGPARAAASRRPGAGAGGGAAALGCRAGPGGWPRRRSNCTRWVPRWSAGGRPSRRS